MTIIPEGRIAYFDVDDTLVYWHNDTASLDSDSNEITVNHAGRSLKRFVIIENVQELIKQAESGTKIVVWSAGGSSWAESIVKALKIEEYVDLVVTKPDRIYDDKDPECWMPKRRYYGKLFV